jgi:hypothetical protein
MRSATSFFVLVDSLPNASVQLRAEGMLLAAKITKA